MAKGKIKDITGVIARTTKITQKTHTKKSDNSSFTIYSIGIMLDNGEWYNIKGSNKDKVQETMHDKEVDRDYKTGDAVKIYLESEDKDEKWWKITSISLLEQQQKVEEEEIVVTPEQAKQTGLPVSGVDGTPPIDLDDVGEESPIEKQDESKPELKPGESSEGGPAVRTNEEREKEVKATTKQKTLPKKELPSASPPPQKDMATVDKFKEQEADKYEIGMAKNGADVILAAMIESNDNLDFKGHEKKMGEYLDYWQKLVEAKFTRGRRLRKKLLGY